MQTKKHWAALTMGLAMGVGATNVSVAQDKSEPLQEIVVTGSRIARPNLESTVPVAEFRAMDPPDFL